MVGVDVPLCAREESGGRVVDVTVVIGTRDRREQALATVRRLRSLPERPPVIVVDDGSIDGTADAVRHAFPDVVVVDHAGPRGVTAARNAGVRRAHTPYVAFADDDSWWAPGALPVISRAFAAHPRLAVVAARIVVGDDERLDPTCAVMSASPLSSDGLPGPRVLGFVACGTAVRREAFLAVCGFPHSYVIGGEEEPLALALAAAGWDLAYVDEAVAHHHPDTVPRDRSSRDRRMLRNDLWTAWRHRRGLGVLARTGELFRDADSPAKRRGILDAARGLPHVLATRRPVPAHIEAQLRQLTRPAQRHPHRR